MLYHKYAGHDNNRDAFQTNMVESQYMAKIMFTDWKPEAYVDHHHMGSYGARIYLPPYAEPVRPSADPLLWRELSWYGAHMAYKEEEAGESGAINMAQYSGWGHFGFHWITPFHNIAGMLTESASAKLASPLYIHPEQLEGESATCPNMKRKQYFRTHGRAAGGGCAILWTGRKHPPGPYWIWRRAIRKRFCGTPT